MNEGYKPSGVEGLRIRPSSDFLETLGADAPEIDLTNKKKVMEVAMQIEFAIQDKTVTKEQIILAEELLPVLKGFFEQRQVVIVDNNEVFDPESGVLNSQINSLAELIDTHKNPTIQ